MVRNGGKERSLSKNSVCQDTKKEKGSLDQCVTCTAEKDREGQSDRYPPKPLSQQE